MLSVSFPVTIEVLDGKVWRVVLTTEGLEWRIVLVDTLKIFIYWTIFGIRLKDLFLEGITTWIFSEEGSVSINR